MSIQKRIKLFGREYWVSFYRTRNKQCPECGAYSWDPERHSKECHAPGCSRHPALTQEEMWATVRRHDKSTRRMQDLLRKAVREREFWHGKYGIVKHENNQLRKKLRNDHKNTN